MTTTWLESVEAGAPAQSQAPVSQGRGNRAAGRGVEHRGRLARRRGAGPRDRGPPTRRLPRATGIGPALGAGVDRVLRPGETGALTRPPGPPGSNDCRLHRPDPTGPAIAGRARAGGSQLVLAARRARGGHEPERGARLSTGSDPSQRHPSQVGALARHAGQGHATAERGSVRPPAERALGGSLPRANARAGARARRAAGPVVRGAPALPAPLGPGPAAPLPAAPRKNGERGRLNAHNPSSCCAGASRRPYRSAIPSFTGNPNRACSLLMRADNARA